MKLFRKKLEKQHEKVLVEARDLAAQRLEQYIADRQESQAAATDTPKKPALTRLKWWS